MRNPYPHLASFLGGWFHQDFDLVGSTLEEVVAEFKRSAAPGESGVICREIDQFLKDHGAAAGDGFAGAFDIGVDPLGFAPTVQAFLLTIREQLGGLAAAP
jgi:CdiI immunity protein